MLEKKEIIPHYAIHIHFLPTANSSHLGTSFPELKLVSFSIQETIQYLGLPCWLSGKEFAYNAEDMGLIWGWEDSLEKEMITHSSILAWRIPWTEEPGGL